jgi:hypothetical protein
MDKRLPMALTTCAVVCALWIVLDPSRAVEAANPAVGTISPTASDHFIHASNISTGGTLGPANRNLIDYFQVFGSFGFVQEGGAVHKI